MKVKVKKLNRNFWKDFWKLLEPSHKQIFSLIVLTVFFELAALLGPYILKLIIDKISNFTPEEIISIIFLSFLMFLSEQLNSLLHYFRDRKIFKLVINIEYYLPIQAQKKLVHLSLNYHEQENTGNKITKIERGINKILDLLMNLSWEVGPTLVKLTTTLLILLIIDWRFALSLLFFAPLFIYITFKVNKDLHPTRKIRHKKYEKASGIMGQSIININTVKSFVQESREIKKYTNLRKDIKEKELKEWYHLTNFGLIRNLVIDLGRVTILLLGVYLVYHNSVSIGTFVFVITLSEKSYFSLYRLSRFYDKVEEGAEAINRFMQISRQENDIANPKNGIKPKEIKGKIEFNKVSFSYNEAEENALKNINLTIQPGSITALVGPSGGGKTTLARMLYRHYDPQQGQVKLDGIALKKYDLYSFRKFFAIVPQEVEIFDTTISENIAYAKPNATQKEIEKAARIANAEEFINKLPQKYETKVGERGIKLSGGQRQRLGIARAILADPQVLIFDEATSNLDSQSEKLIQDAMEKISKGRTVILIAHRLSTIQKANNIVVLEKGELVEQGTHAELSQTECGLYNKLLNLQKLGDVD